MTPFEPSPLRTRAKVSKVGKLVRTSVTVHFSCVLKSAHVLQIYSSDGGPDGVGVELCARRVVFRALFVVHVTYTSTYTKGGKLRATSCGGKRR